MRSIVTKSLTKEFFFVAVIERTGGSTIVAFKTDTSATSYEEQARMVVAVQQEIGMKREDLDSEGGTHLFPCTDEADQMLTVRNLLNAAERHGVDATLVTKRGSGHLNGGQRASTCN